MVLKAKQKGFRNLVLADAHAMPFKDGSFDASIIIHVLHLLPDWLGVIEEMGRVTTNKVAALLSNRQGEWNSEFNVSGGSSQTVSELWTRYAQLREQNGYPIRRNKRMWQNEIEIRSKLPPSKIVEVSNEVVTTKLKDLMTRFQHGPFCWQPNIPSEIHKKIIEQLFASIENYGIDGKETASVMDKEITRTLKEELAIWQPNQIHPNSMKT